MQTRAVSRLQNKSSRRARGGKALGALASVVLSLVIGFVAVSYGQQLLDIILASRFTPSVSVKTADERLQLTDKAQTIFYASYPAIEPESTFNTSCQSTERTTAMLGCYYRRQIYLFDITNKELDGAVEVTAAHEMLHAAYERLPFFERPKVDRLVESQYEKLKGYKDLADLVAYYQKAEPGALTNELHSIIGTTFEGLDPELEQYYARYFKDRKVIVSMSQSYNAVFKKVQTQSEELSTKLDKEGPAIEVELARYNTDRTQLELDIESFNQRASSGGFGSRGAFTVARTALVARADELNSRRTTINQRVADYNQLVEQLKALSVRSAELNKSINGISSPGTSV